MSSPISRARAGRSCVRISSIAPSAAAQATGLPPYVPPRPPTCTASISSARPVTAASGQPPAMPLAVVTRSGTTPSWSRGEPVAGAAEAGLDLVGDEDDPVLAAPGRQGGQEAAGRDHEAALALDRLDHHAGEVRGADLLVQHVDGPGRGLLAGEAVPERVGHRRPVDLAGERARTRACRACSSRHRHREVGAAVVGVVEDRHRVPAGGHAGDLHGVLDRLGAGVEQRRLLRRGRRGSARPAPRRRRRTRRTA